MDSLTEENRDYSVNYLRFMRYKRAQHVHDVEASFSDLKESRLNESTFTCDEVVDMLDGLSAVVKGNVESELIHSAHTNVVLLRQMFMQAEKWSLKLKLDISELENRQLLEEVARFEREQFSHGLESKTLKLKPIDEGASPALMQAEIARLKEENAALQSARNATSETAQRTESDLQVQAKELVLLRKQLQEALNQASKQVPPVAAAAAATTSAAAPAASSDTNAVAKELAEAKQDILKLTAEMDQAKKDLEAKFNETAQFLNMKKMLETKNDQIKELRSRLGE